MYLVCMHSDMYLGLPTLMMLRLEIIHMFRLVIIHLLRLVIIHMLRLVIIHMSPPPTSKSIPTDIPLYAGRLRHSVTLPLIRIGQMGFKDSWAECDSRAYQLESIEA